MLLAALLISLLASALVLALAHATGLGLASRRQARDGALALVCAQAGVEQALELARSDTDWRANLLAPEWLTEAAVGAGRVTVTAGDPGDGLLAANGSTGSSTADTLRLTARAWVRDAERGLRVDCLPLPHTALRAAAFGASYVGLQGVVLEGRVRGNGEIRHVGGATLYGDITTLEGASVSNDLDDDDTYITYVTTSLALPSVDFSWFRAAGEQVSLPWHGTLLNTHLTPEYNPYGSVSAEGIYWIDAHGGDVYLYNVALEACLAVVDASDVVVGDWWGDGTRYYHRSPDPERLPALLVDGDLTMRIEASSEYHVPGIGTVTSGVEGVFFCTGDFWGPQYGSSEAVNCEGAFLANKLHLTGPGTRIRHAPELNLRPLVELAGNDLRPLPGTRREL